MKNILKIKFFLSFALVISFFSVYTLLNNKTETKYITQSESIEQKESLVLSASTTPLITETNVNNITKEDVISWIKDYITLSKTEEYTRETPPAPVYNTYITRTGGSSDGLAHNVGKSVTDINNNIGGILTSPSISGDAYFDSFVGVGNSINASSKNWGLLSSTNPSASTYKSGLKVYNEIVNDENITNYSGITQSLSVTSGSNSGDYTSYSGIHNDLYIDRESTKKPYLINGIYTRAYASVYGPGASDIRGINIYAAGKADAIRGAHISGEAYSSTTVTTTVNGVLARAASFAAGAVVTNASALTTQNFALYGGIITNAYGLNIPNSSTSGGGYITNMYGIYLEGQTTATNNWNLYSLGATSKHYIEGLIGLGTTTPSAKLGITQSANDATGGLWIAETGNTDFRSIYMDTSGVMSFYGGDTAGALNTATLNSAGAWTNASDISYKENITNLSDKYTLEDLMKIQPRFYIMKGTNLPQIGFIAQELEQVIPEVVDGKDGSKGISYGNLVALVVSALQELNLKVDNLIKDIGKYLAETAVYIKEVTVGKLKIEGDICVNNTCITKDQFEAMILRSGVGATQTNMGPVYEPPTATSTETIENQATTTMEIIETATTTEAQTNIEPSE